MRACHNPECMAEYEDDHITICLECGWGTRAVEKKKKVKADGNGSEYRHKPAESS